MKKQNFLAMASLVAILLYCYVAISAPSHAQEATPTAERETEKEEVTPKPKDSQLEKIKKLKERVATKVAELKKKGRRAHFGQIKEIGQSSILLTTKKGEVVITVDEETKIFRVGAGQKRKESLGDLKVGEKIVAFGFSEEIELPAKVIIAKEMPINVHGKVIKVDIEAGTITVETTKKGDFLVDYEKTTLCRIFEKGKGLIKGGLSKVNVDDRVHVTATQGEEENQITARRILVLPGKALGIVGRKESVPTTTLVPSPTTAE